jgi:hypothetical protein
MAQRVDDMDKDTGDLEATERLLTHMAIAAPKQVGAIIRSIVQAGDVALLERVIESGIATECQAVDRDLVAAMARLPEVVEDKALAESLTARWIEKCGGINQRNLDISLAYANSVGLAEDLLRMGANPNAWLPELHLGKEITPLSFAFENENLPQVMLMLKALAVRGEVPLYSRSASIPGEKLRQPDEGANLFNYFVRAFNTRTAKVHHEAVLDELRQLEMPDAWRLAIGRAFVKPPKDFGHGRPNGEKLDIGTMGGFARLISMADFDDPKGWATALSIAGGPYEIIDMWVVRDQMADLLLETVRRAHGRGIHVDEFHSGHSPDDDRYYQATLLQVATIYNRPGLAAALIEMGADVTRRFPDSEDFCHGAYVGKSILQICRENSQDEIEQMVHASLAKKRIDETLANAKQGTKP